MLVSRRNASDGLDRRNNVHILTSRELYLSIHANMYIQSRQRYSVTVQSIVSIQRPHLSWPLVSICILDHNVLICLQTTYFRWTAMQQPSTSGVTTHVINLHTIDLSFLCILFLRTVHQWCCNCLDGTAWLPPWDYFHPALTPTVPLTCFEQADWPVCYYHNLHPNWGIYNSQTYLLSQCSVVKPCLSNVSLTCLKSTFLRWSPATLGSLATVSSGPYLTSSPRWILTAASRKRLQKSTPTTCTRGRKARVWQHWITECTLCVYHWFKTCLHIIHGGIYSDNMKWNHSLSQAIKKRTQLYYMHRRRVRLNTQTHVCYTPLQHVDCHSHSGAIT